MITKKGLIDDLLMLLTKSDQTDESRFDEDYISTKLDQVRGQLIQAEFRKTNILDNTWKQHLGKLTFEKINFADSVALVYGGCKVSKTTVPQILSLESGSGNQDLGITLISSSGRTRYHMYPMSGWANIPAEHTRSKFRYFDRINTDLYINTQDVSELIGWAILACPEDAKLIQSSAVASGSIANGVSYTVKFGQVIYNGVTYQPNTTFTGTTGVTTFATGAGKVYLTDQVRVFRATDPYPVNAEMARLMVIELITKEYAIEMKVIPDTRNDNKDDAQKIPV